MSALLRRPAGTGPLILAILTALLAGVVAADAGGRLTRAAGPGLPTGDTFTAIAATVYPGAAVEVEDGTRFFEDEPAWRSFMADRDGTRELRTFGWGAAVPGDEQPWVAAARTRVAAAGWQIQGDGETWDGHSFWATRDDLRLDVYGSSGDPEPGVAVTTTSWSELRPTQPWWATVLMLLAGLLGAAGGWLLIGAIGRRTAQQSRAVRAYAHDTTVIALLLAIPLWWQTMLVVVTDVAGLYEVPLRSDGTLFGLVRWPAALALLLMASVVLVTVSRPRRASTVTA